MGLVLLLNEMSIPQPRAASRHWLALAAVMPRGIRTRCWYPEMTWFRHISSVRPSMRAGSTSNTMSVDVLKPGAAKTEGAVGLVVHVLADQLGRPEAELPRTGRRSGHTNRHEHSGAAVAHLVVLRQDRPDSYPINT